MPRYASFIPVGKHRWAQVTDNRLQPLASSPLDGGTPQPSGEPIPLGEVRWAPPCRPSKIVCIGRNYHAHAAELGNEVPESPLIFLKPPSCLIGHGGAIDYPTGHSELVHHEGELAVVIGRRTRRIREEDAADHVFGYTLFNDVTARDLQRRDVQFTRAKSFDTFGAMGPWIDTDFEPADQRLTVHVNGELRQDGRLSQMVFKPAWLVAWISQIMTLEGGDVISTGTPAGVGPLLPGDRVDVAIEGLGTLSNDVVADAEP